MAQYKLVIAEKPSVAQSLAAVIGATARKDGYLEGNGWRVSWCVGHLAGLADADSYDQMCIRDSIMSDTDDSFNFLISMCYTQLFNLLCEKADDVYGGRLPVHVRCLICLLYTSDACHHG